MLDNKQIWDQVLVEIELTVSKANFGTWFKNTFISRIDQGIVYLGVPNTFVKDWLFNKYHKNILKSLRDMELDIRGIEYLITKSEDRTLLKENERTMETLIGGQLNLGALYVDKESNLNSKYTFNNFIVGPFNEVAYAAAQAVVKNPGLNYNPLFIYGGTGLGKTHIIQAAGNHLRKNGKRVYYITSENFTVDYINSVQNNKVNQFKERFRKYDALIIDDVQFFSGKEKTQEELFHLFNNFHADNRQIVFSSDKPPKYIQNLEERLRSRFEGGMTVDISKPDYESRLAILRSKLQGGEYDLSDDIVEFLASVIQDNIRELEGALNTIVCQTQAKKKALSLSEVKNLIKNNIKPQKTVSFKDVIRVVADFYGIDEKSLFEKTRRKEVVKPRQIIMFLLREDFSTSYPYIGQKLGGRDHTTVIHACDKIKSHIKTDSLLNQELTQIRMQLYNSY